MRTVGDSPPTSSNTTIAIKKGEESKKEEGKRAYSVENQTIAVREVKEDLLQLHLRRFRWITLIGILWGGVIGLGHTAEAPNLVSQPESPIDTDVMVRVVAHGSMVLGDDVGGARVTITDVATGRLLASGMQLGEPGDQNQIMRTPRLMEEPHYSTRPSGSFRTTLSLEKPTLVEIAAQGPLHYPAATQRASTTVLLIPGRDLTNDGIVLHLYGFIVQIETPAAGQPLMAKDDVKLTASVRTLSGSLVRPHSDWDSRKISIHGEVLIGDRVVERLQMFYSGTKNLFEAPFFVPSPTDAPNGVALRVVVADGGGANFGMGQAHYPVVPAQFKRSKH